MAPARRWGRQTRFADRRGDTISHGTSIEREPPVGDVADVSSVRPGHANEVSEEMEVEVEIESNALMSTPQARAPSNALFGTADLSRPLTRSTRKGYFDSILVETPLAQRSQAQNRLHLATASNGVSAIATSHLEEAQDIDYGHTEADGEEGHEQGLGTVEDQNGPAEPEDEEPEDSRPTTGGLRVPRRSDRIRAKARAAREPSPSTALAVSPSSNNRIQKRRNKNATQKVLRTGPRRRSARLAKPLDAFHKYSELPPELKLMIWEAAIQPRLAYICNRASTLGHAHFFGIQNKIPPWFMACRMSAYIAKRNYQKLFAQVSVSQRPALGQPLRHQDINPSVDIVIFEPCHNGCRGYYCAQQYRGDDRAAIQRLAVQIDSPHLPTMSEPGWATISRSWPNVETLFMMKPAVRGLDESDKAMIRIKEGDHEVALRKLFETWKKGEGQGLKLTTLEFVRVVEQEAETKNPKDRYQSVVDRKTGLVEDIVLG